MCVERAKRPWEKVKKKYILVLPESVVTLKDAILVDFLIISPFMNLTSILVL
jgi:hypothetical protein